MLSPPPKIFVGNFELDISGAIMSEKLKNQITFLYGFFHSDNVSEQTFDSRGFYR